MLTWQLVERPPLKQLRGRIVPYPDLPLNRARRPHPAAPDRLFAIAAKGSLLFVSAHTFAGVWFAVEAGTLVIAAPDA